MITHYIFIFTFIFGTLRFLSFLKIFDTRPHELLTAISPFELNEFWRYIQKLLFYACLLYQTYFWTTYFKII